MIDSPIPVDLLIFDFDGTITDSIPSAVEALQKTIKILGFPYRTKDEINKHVGLGEVPLVSGSIGSNDPTLLKKALETYQKIYKAEGINKVMPYPHVRDMLEHFSKKTKVIVSNKKDEFIGLILKNLRLERYFDKVFGGDSAPCLKPDPCAILHMLEIYGSDPKRTIFVGDMVVDVQTARNAGVISCAVTYGFDSREKLTAAGPDLMIEDMLELTDMVV